MRIFSVTGTVLVLLMAGNAQAQFTRGDSLRGGLSEFRTCYDVTSYHLDVRIDPARKTLEGSNLIRFTAAALCTTIQVDLFSDMKIRDIRDQDGRNVPFRREFNAVFLDLPDATGDARSVTISYSGTPITADRPPWSGGFTWTTDELGNPWVAVSCQGIGASVWWPNKDHPADEPDSMLISVTVPQNLMNISNGRLRGVTDLDDGWRRYDWFVGNPINNYNVTVNIGAYDHFADTIVRDRDTLTLDYYVMPYNREKAARQFRQVHPTLACFEKYFGPYPFPEDGFKLIEVPYLGMEHQSAIAYGNQYMNGYAGTAQSAVGPASRSGLLFDFIIVHEAAHEWWGNSVTAADVADLWIHESFGAYAEAVFVEEQWGYEAALDYVNAKKASVANDTPIIGVYGVHQAGSRDMYNKGQLVLNTLRHAIGDDEVWWRIIREIPVRFRHSVVTAGDILEVVNELSGSDYSTFFMQYFQAASIPELQVYIEAQAGVVTMHYRWNADVEGFAMPVDVTVAPDRWERIRPTTVWQTMTLDRLDPREFRIAEDLFYVTLDLRWAYLAPEKSGDEFIRSRP